MRVIILSDSSNIVIPNNLGLPDWMQQNNPEMTRILKEYNVPYQKFMQYQKNPWIRFLHKQYLKVHKHKWNMLSCTVGLPRTGKSVFTAYSCSMLNPRFEMKRDIVYTANQFKERIYGIEHIGETIIWDEAGVGLSSRDWFKIQNKEIGRMLQTVGHMRPIIFFVTPDSSFIDSQARKLFHHFFEVFGRTENYSKIKPFKFVVDKKKGHIYYQYPKYVHDGLNKFKVLNFWKPPQLFIDQYDEHSNPQKVKLRAKSEKNEEKDKKMDLLALQKKILENYKDYIEQRSPNRISWKLIMAHWQDILKECGKPREQAEIISALCQQELDKKLGVDYGRTRFNKTNNQEDRDDRSDF